MPRKHTNIGLSITPELYKLAMERAERLGFENSFSAYIQKLIKDDLDKPPPPGQGKKPETGSIYP